MNADIAAFFPRSEGEGRRAVPGLGFYVEQRSRSRFAAPVSGLLPVFQPVPVSGLSPVFQPAPVSGLSPVFQPVPVSGLSPVFQPVPVSGLLPGFQPVPGFRPVAGASACARFPACCLWTGPSPGCWPTSLTEKFPIYSDFC